MGGVETKKQLAFPGYELERYQLSAVGNSKYGAKLEAVISYVEETGVYYKMEAADVYGDKTSKNWWLNLVSNEADRLLFQKAHCWDEETPEELKPFLTRNADESWSAGKRLCLTNEE